MKLIERFFGKKEEIPSRLSLDFNELPGWIESESENFLNQLSSHIRQKYEEIGSVLEDISVSRDQLIEAKFGEKVYVRMAKAGASNRENVVKNLNIIIERTVIPGDTTPSGALEFHANAKSTLNTCLDNAIRSQQYVKRLFPEEYKSVLFDLKHLESLLDELVLPINESNEKLMAYDGLPGEIGTIINTGRQIEEKRRSVRELEQRSGSLKHDLAAEEAGLEELEKSGDFIKAQELEKQAEILEDQISAVDLNVKELFAPLSKALSRVEKQDKSGRHTLSAGHRKVLKILIEDPVSALKTDISPFLTELKTRVGDGSLGLKQQKQNKTIEQIDKLIGSDVLPSLSSQRDSRLSELARLSGELEGLTVYKEKTQIKRKISECKGRIGSTERELDDDRRELERLTDEIGRLKADLDSDLSHVFDRDIGVVYGKD